MFFRFANEVEAYKELIMDYISVNSPSVIIVTKVPFMIKERNSEKHWGQSNDLLLFATSVILIRNCEDITFIKPLLNDDLKCIGFTTYCSELKRLKGKKVVDFSQLRKEFDNTII